MNKKYLLLGTATALLVFSTLACQAANNMVSGGLINPRAIRGSGNVSIEQRPVSGFNAVDLASLGNLVIEMGDQEALRIEAEDNLLEYIETEVRGDTLEIGIRQGVNLNPSEPIRYYLTVKTLGSILVSGLGDVDAPELQAERLSVNISGGGNVDIDSLTANQLSVGISGLGNLTIFGGQVGDQDIHISGGGYYKADEMQSAKAQVDISGMGSTTIRVSESLDANISGGGSVLYYGSPSVDESISGLGKVEQIGE